MNFINLIKNDIYKLRALSKIILIVVPLSLLSAFFSPNLLPIAFIIGLFAVGVGIMAYDDYYGTYALYRALPVSPKQVVAAKYAFHFVLLAALVILLTLCALLSPNKSIIPVIPTALLIAIFGTLYTSIVLTLSFYLPMTKVRIIAIIFYAIAFGVSNPFMDWLTTSDFLTNFTFVNGILLLLIPILITAISYPIGLTLYKRKELVH